MAQHQTEQQQAAELFQRYAGRLIALARSRLSAKVSKRVDPEDVVQSAYRSFFAGAREGSYDLQQGGDIWHLLVAITLHKLKDQVKLQTAKKRSVDREQHFGSEDSLLGLQAAVLARDVSPLEALSLVDHVEQLMRPLTPPQRRIVEMRLQGYDLREIAAATQRSVPTVRRVLDGVKKQLKDWCREQSGS